MEQEHSDTTSSAIRINPRVWVFPDELEERFVRASGAGGQNVNKVSTAVQLRFDSRQARGLPFDVRLRLRSIAGKRMNREGVILIDARRHRTQERNRQDAKDRLFAMLAEASVVPTRRVPTLPSRASRRRRVDDKKHRAKVKRGRGPVDSDN